jgi:hypothetical protein
MKYKAYVHITATSHVAIISSIPQTGDVGPFESKISPTHAESLAERWAASHGMSLVTEAQAALIGVEHTTVGEDHEQGPEA